MIEVLVGIAVLTVLTTLLATAFSSFTRVTSNSNQRIEVNKLTRAVFDRMAFDLGSAVTTGGVHPDFRKNQKLPTGSDSRNDAMVLLTNAKTGDPDGRLAKIGYGIGNYDDQSRDMSIRTLLRYTEPFGWDDDTTLIEVTNGAAAQPIAPGVLRFELAFVDRNGDVLAGPPAGNADSTAVREFYDNLESLICTVATLDPDSLQKLTDAQLTSIVNRLGDATDGDPPLANWQGEQFEDLPDPVAQGLRFHQKYFPIQ